MGLANKARITCQVMYNVTKGRLQGYKPFFLSHLITSECNFSCPECYWKDTFTTSLSTNDIRSLYSQAKKYGFVGNYIWGGEPLIRKDIVDILAASKENGMANFVNTNGWFLLKKLHDIAPMVDVFILSIDHSKAEGHDKIRGAKGSFDRLMEAIDTLKTRYPRIRFFINTLVMKENEDDIENILNLWKRLGIAGYMNFIEVDLFKPLGKNDQNKELDVAENTRRDISKFLLLKKKEGYPILNTDAYFRSFLEGKSSYCCHFPKIFLEIMPDGSVLDCVREDQPIGNVMDTPLKTILEHPRIAGMIDDGEKWCHIHNNADRIDASNTWELHPESLTTGMRFLFRRI